MSEAKRPIGLTLFGILFAIVGLMGITKALSEIAFLATKDQQVKILEDQLARAEKTQDFKPSAIQREYAVALKEYPVSPADFLLRIATFTVDIWLVLLCIAIFTKNPSTVSATNWYLLVDFVLEALVAVFTMFIKPLPTPATLKLSEAQTIILTIQQFLPVVLTLALIFWYFNRKPIRAFFQPGSASVTTMGT